MDLRISENTKEWLEWMADFSECTMTHIVIKALKKWNRVHRPNNVELWKQKKDSTNKKSIKVALPDCLIADKTPVMVRNIIDWYLEDQRPRRTSPLDLDKYSAGYEIIEIE